jgi:hypothetical protein
LRLTGFGLKVDLLGRSNFDMNFEKFVLAASDPPTPSLVY